MGCIGQSDLTWYQRHARFQVRTRGHVSSGWARVGPDLTQASEAFNHLLEENKLIRPWHTQLQETSHEKRIFMPSLQVKHQ